MTSRPDSRPALLPTPGVQPRLAPGLRRGLLCATLLFATLLFASPTGDTAPKRRPTAAATGESASPPVPEGPVLMGPFLRDLARVGRKSEVTVVFRTVDEVMAEVLYRVPGEEDVRLTQEEPSYHHVFKLKDLEPDKIYVYRLVVDGKELPGGSFTTPPKPETPVLIGVYGDTRKYDGPHAEVCAGIVRRSVDLLVHTGDFVHDGYKMSDWITFFRIERENLRSTPMFPVIGNHDDRGKMGKWWFETLFGPNAHFRSITYGSVHLVILSSEGQFREQARWLEEDLRRMRAEKPQIHYVLAFIHHGPWGTGRFNGNTWVRHHFVPILRKYGPAIVFSGHEHDYERGVVDGFPFYVTGGGGAVLEGRRCRGPCPKWSHIWKSIYHYLIVEAAPGLLRICAYYPSGLEVEPCISYPMPERQARDEQEEGDAGAPFSEEGEVPPSEEPPPVSHDDPQMREGGDYTVPEPPLQKLPPHELPPEARKSRKGR